MPAFRVKFAQPRGAAAVREVRTANSIAALRLTKEWYDRNYPSYAFRPLQVERWNSRTKSWEVRITEQTIELNSAYLKTISHPEIGQRTREYVDTAYRTGDLNAILAIYAKLTA